MIRRLIHRVMVCATALVLWPVAANAVYDWPAISLVPVASGLPSSTHITNAGDGSGRLFVVQQTGQIRIIKNNTLLTTPFLDISSRLSCCVERGLLSVAFPPSYATKGYFYVYYTDAAAGSVTLARYFVTANPDVANFNSEQIVLSIPHSTFPNHNGGQLAFGPDGYLYMGPGDGGGGGDTLGNGQNTNALLGKILRLDVETGVIPYPTPTPNGHAPYVVPPSNPFVSTAGYRPEIWALGMRNPFRFSFDRQTGDLYIGDVGQNTYEEVDYQPVSSFGGQNYGWNIMEGFHCYPSTASCSSAGLTLPVIEYDHSQGDCSITGGFVYRGAPSARMNGVYFYSDYCTGKITGAVRQGGTWITNLLYDAPFNVTTFGQDEAANLYLNDYTGGVIYLINDTLSNVPTWTPTPTATPLPSVGPCGPVTWKNVVNVTASGNNIQKTAGAAAWDAGAISSLQLVSGDGGAQVQILDSTSGYRMFGLSNGDPDQGYTSIRYALYPAGGGGLYVYESGVLRGQFGTYAVGDFLKVELSGGVVRYYRMPAGSGTWTLLYTSGMAPSYPLLLDTSIATLGAWLQNVQFGTGTCQVPATPTPTFTPPPTSTPPPTLTRTATPTFTSTPTGGAGPGPCGPVTWASLVNVTANGSSIQKTGGAVAWDAGAVSSTQLASGDGGAEIQVMDGTSSYRMFGLSNGNPDANYTSIKYALYPAGGGGLYVFESGVNRGQFGTYGTGDLLKVEVTGGVVRYSRMAAGSGTWTVLYTSTVAPSYPLLLDTSIATPGGGLQNVQFGTGTCGVSGGGTPTNTPMQTPTAPPSACGPVTWASLVNVTANGNSIQKTGGAVAWDAGAVSSTQLASGDGGAEIQVMDGTSSYRMFGLSNGNPDANYTSIKYAFYPAGGGGLYVFESGVNRGQFGTYGTGDLLKVEVTGGVVRYSRKASGSGTFTLLYTSAVAPSYPLLLDTSIATPGGGLQNVKFGAGTCP